MAKVKVSHEDLKRTDLRDFADDLREWYERRKTLVLVIVVSLLGLLVLNSLWGAYRDRRKAEASEMYLNAVDKFQEALFTPDVERRTGLLTEVQALASNVRNRYPSTPAARQALLLVGNALYYQEQPEKALTQFNEFSETASNSDEEAIGWISIGYCYENIFFNGRMSDVSQWQNALDYYKKAEKEADSQDVKRHALLGQARMYEYVNKIDEALKVHEQILKLAEASKADDEKKFFGKDEEKEQSKLPILNPADVYDTASLAKQQMERLKALAAAGSKIEAERNLPAATAPTTQATTAPAAATQPANAAASTAPVQ